MKEQASVRRALRLGGTTLMIALIALAGGGLVVALDHPATGTARPELTARGDAAFQRAAPPLAASLDDLAARTDALAATGRAASVALRAGDPETVRASLDDGEAELIGADLAAEGVRAGQDRLVADVSGLRLSAASTAALVAVDEALGMATTLSEDLAQVASAAGAAADIIGVLQAHDELVFGATEAARGAGYDAALSALDQAEAVLAPLLAARDADGARPAATLDDWLARATDYDTALRRLYEILDASGGSPSPASRAAAVAVDRAQAALPEDGSALIVIASELAEPDLTEGLVGIEGVRGSITEAVLALD